MEAQGGTERLKVCNRCSKAKCNLRKTNAAVSGTFLTSFEVTRASASAIAPRQAYLQAACPVRDKECGLASHM